MKKVVTFCMLLLVPLIVLAQTGNDWSKKGFKLGEVTVWGHRPMKDIGVQQTKFDSLSLKENISLSMADILTFNAPVFVKSYGRATLSTVAFRGTSPSHTQVTWNDMRINNPMLGMTDFSMIPSYFIDNASLLHGTSSVNETGGGLGGLVKLSTEPTTVDGIAMQYIQGVGSFKTFDEFLRLTYGNEHWKTSTRIVYQSSPNEYKYRNHDKKENIYDDNHHIIGRYYPTEKNKSASYKDFHLLQEVYYNTLKGDRFGINAWFIHSNRELPMLTTDYGDEKAFENRQRENTLRSIMSWDHYKESWKMSVKSGYIHTWMGYDYKRDKGNGILETMTHSRSQVNTVYGQTNGDYSPSDKWYFTSNLSVNQHYVKSSDKKVTTTDGDNATVGYNKKQTELSGSASAKWRTNERIGMSIVLREEMSGNRWSPVIPAFFFDGILSKAGNITIKASISKNYKFPTLNDLFFLPGGNPNLKNESGFNYESGLSFAIGKENKYTLSGSASWFDQYINNWIIWLPTTKGFFSPKNIKQVHAYGIESRLDYARILSKDWMIRLDGTYSWTPSINKGEPMSPADQSVGKQLPYVPKHSATVNGRLSYKSWSFLYKWCYYSERYTMSSNDNSLTGHLPDYFMSNISIEKEFTTKWADLNVKSAINNLFDEEYLSVLSRPMPGINFEIFISIKPKW